MARKMSPEEYQELGRRYYKLKQYDKAAETFSNGIEACATASLYDHRAAAHEKLENFNAAVKDGREMIRLDKKDVKGYLRTASVLEKMGKHETALGIYKYGMKNVDVGDRNFKVCGLMFLVAENPVSNSRLWLLLPAKVSAVLHHGIPATAEPFLCSWNRC
jgi:F-box/TPR repeat protein Pof3